VRDAHDAERYARGPMSDTSTERDTSTRRAAPIAPLDLAAERAELGNELEEAVLQVLRSGRYVLGPEVEAFERSFAELCGVAHGVGVASGTDALIVALRALGIGRGDAILTTPFTFFASASTIALCGARPVLADVDLETGLLDLAAAEAAWEPSVRWILPVHIYGQMVDMRAFAGLAERHGAGIVEDAAQAHGAQRDGVRPGERSAAACFSFYPTKNLGAAGEGGLVVTRDDALARRLREVRDHGSPEKYRHAHLGLNSRLQALQGAVLRCKLSHLERWNERRRALASLYDEAFAGVDDVVPLTTTDGAVHARHQYTVRIVGPRDRDRVQRALAEQGIGAAVHYPIPVHLQEAARDWGYAEGQFPNAERLCREVLCLPIHPFLTDADVLRVAAAVRDAAQGA